MGNLSLHFFLMFFQLYINKNDKKKKKKQVKPEHSHTISK